MKTVTAKCSSSPEERIRSTPARKRILDIFVSPGEVFEEVIAAPPAPANWLLPVLLNCFAGILLFLAVAARTSSPPWMDEKARVAQVVLENSSADAKESIGHAGSPGGARLAGATAIIFVTFAGTFWSALVLWLFGRVFLRTHFSWLKTLEIVGLTTVILGLGSVVTALLITATENGFARPALSLMIREFDPANKVHQALAALSLFHIWTAALLSIGLAKLSGVSTRESAVWVFGYWIVLRIMLILLG